VHAADAEDKERKMKVEYFVAFSILFMTIESVFDILYQRLPEKLTWFLFLLAVVGKLLLEGSIPGVLVEVIKGFIPGAIMLLGGKVSRESIGYGDGVVLCFLGVIYGAKDTMEILMYGLLAAAAVSVVLLVVRKKNKKTTLPFVPFLSIGLFFYFVRKGGFA